MVQRFLVALGGAGSEPWHWCPQERVHGSRAEMKQRLTATVIMAQSRIPLGSASAWGSAVGPPDAPVQRALAKPELPALLASCARGAASTGTLATALHSSHQEVFHVQERLGH